MSRGKAWVSTNNSQSNRDEIVNSHYPSLLDGGERIPSNATYSFSIPASPLYYGNDGYAEASQGYKSILRSHFSYINELLNTTFSEGVGSASTIRIAALIDSDGNSSEPGYADSAGSTRNSLTQAINLEPKDGSYTGWLVLHELGHSLGLSHTQRYSNDLEVRNTELPFDYDVNLLSVMSYHKALLSPPSSTESLNINSFSPLDWKALEASYGRNPRNAAQMTYEISNNSLFNYNPVSRVARISASSGFTIANEIDDITLDLSKVDLAGSRPISVDVDAGIDIGSSFSLVEEEGVDFDRYAPFRETWSAMNLWPIYIDSDVRVTKVIGSPDDDILEGDELGQALMAGNGNDVILAGLGDDFIDGGAGRDRITGSEGADSFVVGSPQRRLQRPEDSVARTIGRYEVPRADVITDFKSSQGDKLLISSSSVYGRSISKASAQVLNARSTTFLEKAIISRAPLIFDMHSHILYLNQNGSSPGFGSGGVLAEIQGVNRLSSTDFALF